MISRRSFLQRALAGTGLAVLAPAVAFASLAETLPRVKILRSYSLPPGHMYIFTEAEFVGKIPVSTGWPYTPTLPAGQQVNPLYGRAGEDLKRSALVLQYRQEANARAYRLWKK